MRELTIRGRRIADDTDAYVVAEIGTNHQGNVECAAMLIEAAADCGADAVKLQKRDNRSLFTREVYDSAYHSEHAFGESYGEHREALEFGPDEYELLKGYAHRRGLAFGCTAFDVPSAEFLERLGVDFVKVASGGLTDIPLLQHLAWRTKPVIISTGGGSIEDVDRIWAMTRLMPGEVALLQCTAAYPVRPAEMNLRVIESYRERYPDCVVGLSDHQDGISLAPVAYTLGARVFEKHFTLSRSWKGSDQAFSLEPEGLRRMVKALRETREALGDGVKRRYKSEEAGLRKMAKSLVFVRDLPAGHVLDADDLACKSPCGGLPPYRVYDFVGLRLVRAVVEDELVTEEVAALWD